MAEVEVAAADGRREAAYRQAGAEVPDDLQEALDARPPPPSSSPASPAMLERGETLH